MHTLRKIHIGARGDVAYSVRLNLIGNLLNKPRLVQGSVIVKRNDSCT